MSDITEKTKSGLKWAAVENISIQGIQFVLGLIMARLLVPSDYGIIGMIAIFISISQSVVDSGFSNALVRQKHSTEVDYSTVFYFNVVIGICCYLLLYVSAPAIADFFNTPILVDLVRVLGLNIIINSLSVVQVAKLTSAVNFKTQARCNASAALLSGVLGVLCAYKGCGVWSLVIQQLSSKIIVCVSLWYLAKWKPIFVFSRDSFKRLFAYGSKIFLSGIINQIYGHLNTIIIGKFYTSSELGFYSRGQQFPGFLGDNINGILQKVTFPIFAKIQDDDEHLINVYRKNIKLASMFMFFFMLMLASLAEPLINLLLGEKWLAAVVYLQIFCIAMMFDHISTINLNLLMIKGRSDLFLRLEIVKKTISISILLLVAPLGVIAICLSKVLYSQIAIIINTYYTGKFFGLGYIKQIKDFSKYLILSILSTIPVFLVNFMDINSLLKLLIGGVIGLSCFCITIRKDELFKEYILKLIFSQLGKCK